MLLLAYVDEVIDNHEFVLLFDVNKTKSGISLLDYTQFDLDKLGTTNGAYLKLVPSCSVPCALAGPSCR